MSPVTSDPNASSIGFLILPAFPIYALILATESLRVANQHSGHRLSNWHILSVTVEWSAPGAAPRLRRRPASEEMLAFTSEVLAQVPGILRVEPLQIHEMVTYADDWGKRR